MRKFRLAQSILSLATTPDRADSTIGDFLEQSSTRGSLWFWSNVMRTVFSLCWSDFCSAPLRALGLALGGFASIVLLLEVIRRTVFWAYSQFHYSEHTASIPWTLTHTWLALVVSLLIGWAVARSSKRRELAAGFSVASLFTMLYVLVQVISAMHGLRLRLIGTPSNDADGLFTFCFIPAVCVIATAILFRSVHPPSSFRSAHSRK